MIYKKIYSTREEISFNKDGSQNSSGSNDDDIMLGCVSKSIDEIYAAGRAFNFVANKPTTITLSGNESSV